MGMYTELILGCDLAKDLPKICVDAIDTVINGVNKHPKYDNPQTYSEFEYNNRFIERTSSKDDINAFIKEYGLNAVLTGSSAYFPENLATFFRNRDRYSISVRANCKNHYNRIGKFLKYLKSYVLYGAGPLNLYASVQYEDDMFPTYYFLDGDGVPPINKEAEKQVYNALNWEGEMFFDICDEIIPNYSVSTEEVENYNKIHNTNRDSGYVSLRILADKIIEKYKNEKRKASAARLYS